MDRIVSMLVEFYGKNKDLAHVLIGALGASVLILLLRSIHRILSAIGAILTFIGKRIGVDFAFRRYLGDYLNWVVVEYQDLNLTGIIGAGPKPKLEQVFISLTLSGEHSASDARRRPDWQTSLLRAQVTLRIRYPVRVASAPKSRVFYEQRPVQRARCFFERTDDLWILLLVLALLAAAIAVGGVLPAYLLFWHFPPRAWLAGAAGSISGTILGGLAWAVVAGLRGDDKTGASICGVIGAAYVLAGALLLRFRSMPPGARSGALVGAMLGLGIVSLAALVRRSRATHGECVAEMRRLLRENDNSAILGKPGAGKSTLVQFIALTLARARAGDPRLRRRGTAKAKLGLDTWYLPILIPLRKVSGVLVRRDADGNPNLLIEAWRDRVLPSDLRKDFPEKLFLRMLRRKRCILLLDGLDEVTDSEEFLTVVREIKGLCSRYAGNKFVVTSRFSGWRGGIGSAFREFEIDDLSDAQVGQFIDDWYRAIEENRVTVSPDDATSAARAQRLRRVETRARDLKEAFASVPSIRALAENPLLLSLICFVHYNQCLPRERLSLYHECSKLLLMQWDLEKGLPVDDTDLTLRRKEAIMEELAFSMHTGRIGAEYAGKEATSAEIVSIIGQKLKEFGLSANKARSLFDKLVDRSGIIVCIERYSDRFSFSHLTFQEFYAARHIYENNLATIPALLNEPTENLTGWWREVVLLYVSMVKDSSSLIRELCRSSAVRLDDLSQRRLQIAAQCLVQAVGVQDETVVAEVLQSLLVTRLGQGDGRITEADWRAEVGHYLLRFATTSDFAQTALRFSAKQLVDSVGLDAVVAKLLEAAKSTDSGVAAASLNTLADLTTGRDLSLQLPQDRLIEFLQHPSESLAAAAIHLLSKQPPMLAERQLLERVPFEMLLYYAGRQRIVSRWPDPELPFAIRIGVDHGTVRALRELLATLPDVPFRQSSDVEWVRGELWKTYRTHLGLPLTPDLQLALLPDADSAHSLQGLVAATIYRLSNNDARASYTGQLLDMLGTGLQDERLLAVSVLSILAHTGELVETVGSLVEALGGPYRLVRRAIMDVLPTIDLSVDHRKRAASLIELKLPKLRTQRRTFLGLGGLPHEHLSSDGQAEAIDAIRALGRLGTHDPRILEGLLIGLACESPACAGRVVSILGHDFGHPLEPSVVAGLTRLCLDDPAQFVLDPASGRWSARLPRPQRVAVLAELAPRLSPDGKVQLQGALLDVLRATPDPAEGMPLLSALCRLDPELAVAPGELRTRLTALLEHRDWHVADAAFDLLFPCRSA